MPTTVFLLLDFFVVIILYGFPFFWKVSSPIQSYLPSPPHYSKSLLLFLFLPPSLQYSLSLFLVFFSSYFIEFSTYLSSQGPPVCLWRLDLYLYRYNIFNTRSLGHPTGTLLLLPPSWASFCLLPFPWIAPQSIHSGIQANDCVMLLSFPQIHSVTKFHKVGFISLKCLLSLPPHCYCLGSGSLHLI